LKPKTVLAALCFVCFFSVFLASCMSPEVKSVRALAIESVDLSKVPDGTYEGSYAYGSFSYVVSVHVDNGRIVAIDILKNRATNHAIMAEGVVSRVLSEQKTDVDAVTGATTTSKALLKAIENALTSS